MVGVKLAIDAKVGGEAAGSGDPFWLFPGIAAACGVGVGRAAVSGIQALPMTNAASAGKIRAGMGSFEIIRPILYDSGS